jgi:O-antigen biosynthesis protein
MMNAAALTPLRGAWLRLRRAARRARHLVPGPRTLRCPVCRAGVAAFDPLPDEYERELARHGSAISLDDAETLNRHAYECPLCGATDRDRLYALHFERAWHPPDQGSRSLLDIAPSRALSSFLRRLPGVSYRTADLSMRGVDDRVDVMSLPYGSDSVDVLLCSHVLEHVPDDRRALRELHRVLKPGGWGIVMVPIARSAVTIDEEPGHLSEAERWRRFGQGDHLRLYSREGFLGRVRESGLVVEELGAADFEPGTFAACGVAEGSRLYVAHKSAA